MKKILFVMLCCMASICVFAQSTTTKVVNGAVIDKNGNPLPGAVVEATGGAESTVVDADGTFSIEVPVWLKSLTARYAGMEDNKKKIKNKNMIFQMEPKQGSWFVNIVGGYEFSDEFYRAGIMAGYIKNWGAYIKVMPCIYSDEVFKPSISIGGIKRLTNHINVFLGVGYAAIPDTWEWDRWGDKYVYDCMMAETGFIFNINKFNVNIGIVYDYSGIIEGLEAQVGFGIRF